VVGARAVWHRLALAAGMPPQTAGEEVCPMRAAHRSSSPRIIRRAGDSSAWPPGSGRGDGTGRTTVAVTALVARGACRHGPVNCRSRTSVRYFWWPTLNVAGLPVGTVAYQAGQHQPGHAA